MPILVWNIRYEICKCFFNDDDDQHEGNHQISDKSLIFFAVRNWLRLIKNEKKNRNDFFPLLDDNSSKFHCVYRKSYIVFGTQSKRVKLNDTGFLTVITIFLPWTIKSF